MSALVVHLKDRRTAAGLTQAELADLVEVSRKTVNTVENGVFVPSTVLALKLAAVLNCRVEDLFALPQTPPDAGHRRPAG
ncbi:transcriptional regulator [Rhodobacteraceae bacterium CCMM004]|nr:transcriptional regulator [Rhodobacteraceae bacterium CCMM004]